MKFKLFLLALIGMLCLSFNTKEAKATNVGSFATYFYTGYHFNTLGKDPCYGYGNKCICWLVYYPNLASIEPFDNGNMLTVSFDDGVGTYEPAPETNDASYTRSISMSNHTFPQNTTMRINESANENLVGLTLNIGGMTTDENGVLHYYIPLR